jgi:type I restriction enzyme S subunit
MSASDMAAFEFDWPSLDEQGAIAEVLGALDDKIAANAHMATTAQDLAQLRYARLTAASEIAPMSAHLKPVLGGTPSRSDTAMWAGTERWASAKDVVGAQFGVLIETEENITTWATESTKAKPLPRGSVILTARGTVGAVCRLGEPAAFNQSCYGFEPGWLGPATLYFAVLSATHEAKAMAHGSVFDTITMRTFDHLMIPDLTRSQAHQVEAEVGPLLDTVEQRVRESNALAKTRDALLRLLMSGRIRVKDAERAVDEVL